MAVAELDREEVFGIRFAIVSDADGETNFCLPLTFEFALPGFKPAGWEAHLPGQPGRLSSL